MLSKWGILNRERWVAGRKGRAALPKPQIIQSAALTMFTHISERHSHPERHSLPTASSGAIHSSALPSPLQRQPPPPKHPHSKKLKKDR